MPEYIVTAAAPADILKRPVAENDVITLTEAQAEHHVSKGHVIAKAEAPAAADVDQPQIERRMENVEQFADARAGHTPITDVAELPPADQESTVAITSDAVTPGGEPGEVRPGRGKRF